jgi:hypothetical protein
MVDILALRPFFFERDNTLKKVRACYTYLEDIALDSGSCYRGDSSDLPPNLDPRDVTAGLLHASFLLLPVLERSGPEEHQIQVIGS